MGPRVPLVSGMIGPYNPKQVGGNKNILVQKAHVDRVKLGYHSPSGILGPSGVAGAWKIPT